MGVGALALLFMRMDFIVLCSEAFSLKGAEASKLLILETVVLYNSLNPAKGLDTQDCWI